MIDKKIGFIGGGQMAQALAKGFIATGQVTAEQLGVFDPSAKALGAIRTLIPSINCYDSNQSLFAASDIVLLAIKPQYFDEVVKGLKRNSATGKLIISIVAGIHCGRLTSSFRTERVIRVMPNTPALVQSGASAFCRGSGATDEDVSIVSELMGSVGVVLELPESAMDAVTGLSGSGPAFVFQFIEALADGGVRAGLARDVATQLALHTVRGAAELAIQREEHPAVLKDRVASPGGTTIEGLLALESGGFRAATMNAVSAAARRSAELGES